MDGIFSISGLGPLDAHNLWYTSSQHPERQLSSTFSDLDSLPDPQRPTDPATTASSRRPHHSLLKSSRLGRLTEEERIYVRRRHAVADFGSTWLKPPAIGKTLAQLREERREAEEHAEALRREQLQQELAEAEAEAAARLEAGEAGEEEEVEEVADLDDEIPDAEEQEASDMGFAPIEDSSEEETDSDASEESSGEESSAVQSQSGGNVTSVSRPAANDSDEDEENDRTSTVATPDQTAREHRHNVLLARRMHQDTIRRNMMRRGADTEPADDFYGDGSFLIGAELDENEDLDDGVMGEDDFGDGEMGMERDLDEEVPEAELSAVYEHTDSDESLTSSEEDDQMEVDEDEDDEDDEDDDGDDDGNEDDQFSRFARRVVAQPMSPTMAPRRTLHRADVSDFLAPNQESSILESSPPMRRAARQP